MGLLVDGSRRKVKTIIWRIGDNVSIMRADGTESRNKYHKKDDTDLTFVEQSNDEYAYKLDENQIETQQEGGRQERHTPNIALAHDTIVQEDDRLDFPDGRKYHVTNLRNKGSHQIAVTSLDTT